MSGKDYPSDDDLLAIEKWEVTWDSSGTRPYYAPFFALLASLWWMPDWGWHEYDGIEDGQPIRVFHLSTGGWSGNESLIDAFSRNFIVWSQTFSVHKRGGHYEFRIPRRVEEPTPPPAGRTP